MCGYSCFPKLIADVYLCPESDGNLSEAGVVVLIVIVVVLGSEPDASAYQPKGYEHSDRTSLALEQADREELELSLCQQPTYSTTHPKISPSMLSRKI